ncbi:hypothetical protein BSL78_24749 [Apostichopus japonicus]|uniref:Uncharacterized protein n=1 Tax=Stichopus japonicus TaxID=307972 RepID=A0A2G8JRM6_STIJA|nr:hypothetical protein BSL78_24749 [Apostichopus japonicus]
MNLLDNDCALVVCIGQILFGPATDQTYVETNSNGEKGKKFVHKLAERLIKQSYDVALDSDNLRRSFREVVSAMERGRLKKELLLHFSLYFKKLMHKLHADSKLKAKSTASEPKLPTHVELTSDRTATSTEFMFNLYSQEQEKLPEIHPQGQKKGRRC